MTSFLTRLTTLIVFTCLISFGSAASSNTQKEKQRDLPAVMKNGGGELFLIAAELMSESEMPAPQEESGILSNKNIRIINLGPIVNWEGVDYAPTISADGRILFYVSNRPGSKIHEETGDPSHDFWAARKQERLDTSFFKPYNIDTTTTLGKLGVNTVLNEGAASIAADRQTLYFTACERPDGIGDCDIYRTVIEGDSWGRPTNLGRNVNSKGFDSQPSIAPDQSRIFFISTREGPNSDGELIEENFDIWYSDWDPEMEEWLPAKNLEAVNTKGIEASPFIAADNQTLFFASNGWQPNYGDLDFYVCRYDYGNDTWSKPENLGRPLNTELREQFITLPASGDIIYFSSTREDLSGYQGSLDIFMAFVPTFFKTVIVKGVVVDKCSGENIPSFVSIKNPITGRMVTDSLDLEHTEFEIVVTNTDYGNPRDSIKYVDLEITAVNEKYGKTMKAQRVYKPSKTEETIEAGKPDTVINVTLTLGQSPVLGTEIDEADYVRRMKIDQPELAQFRGLVMEEIQTWEIFPLLNYIFFDLGSPEIPARYRMFESKDSEYKKAFADTTIPGGTLDKYYHILNIYGYRMLQNPDAKLEIIGCNDGTTPEEKRAGLSKERAENVYNYLKNIWGISEDRLKLKARGKPDVISNLKDSLGIQENRRVELICKEWDVRKPVFEKDAKKQPQPVDMHYTLKNGIEDVLVVDRRIEITKGGKPWNTLNDVGLTDPKKLWDWRKAGAEEGLGYPQNEEPYEAQLIVTTKSGAECVSDPVKIPVMQVSTEMKKVDKTQDSTMERYSLILFPFDRSDAGPLNERIMNDYVYERIQPTSKVKVIGHTDVVGLYDHNQRLSERRSATVEKGIKRKTKGKYGELIVEAVGEDEPLYDNSLPEGRFYNRTVQVVIRTPVEAYEK